MASFSLALRSGSPLRTAIPMPSPSNRTSQSRVVAAIAEQIVELLVIPGPREDWFVDPDALVMWLPPTGMRARFDHFDARPGGSYRLVLTYVDPSAAAGKASADTDVVDARFVEVVPGLRVVQAIDFVSDDPAFAGTMTMTWSVTAVAGGTRVDVVAEGVPSGITADDHATGMASSLANLARFVEG